LSRTSDERGRLGGRVDPPAPPDAPAPQPEPETPPYHKEDERQPGFLAVVRETVVLVALAVILAVVFKTFLVAAFYIPSGSMESTLNISDRVLVEKVSYRFGDVQRGDVVVFVRDEGLEATGPGNPIAGFFASLGQAVGVVPPSDRDFIKRVVGLPGDTISCRRGQLVRNNQPVTEPYLDQGTQTDNCDKEVRVGPGQLFVMGDNRSNSQDSRLFGPIQRDAVVGRAFVRIWPLNHIGWLRRDR
jgi:signal peptidase I